MWDPRALVKAVEEDWDLHFPQEARYEKEGMVFNLKGTAVAERRPIDAIEGSGTTMADCFDVSLLDPATGEKVGTATDCLADVKDVEGAISLVGTTYFRPFAGEGRFVSRGLTTVQPTTTGSPGFTHITGAIAAPGENSVVKGNGRFKKLNAMVRLSGAVNMSRLQSHNEITFDCLFVVTPN